MSCRVTPRQHQHRQSTRPCQGSHRFPAAAAGSPAGSGHPFCQWHGLSQDGRRHGAPTATRRGGRLPAPPRLGSGSPKPRAESHSRPPNEAAVWGCLWDRHPLAQGRALPSAEGWGARWGTGVPFSCRDYRTCIKTSEQFTPETLPPA